MYGNQQPLAGNGIQSAAVAYNQQQQQHYYPAPGNSGGGAYFPAQSFQQPQPQPQPQSQSQQPAKHGDPNHMCSDGCGQQNGDSGNPNRPNPQVALSLFDLPAPATVGSLPTSAGQEINELAQLMAVALQHRCEEMRAYERSHQSIFHSSRIPPISIWDYIRRIAKYSGCSPECFIIALIVLDRYSQATGIPLSFRNAHRLCITAVMVSAKLRDDIYYSNEYYSSIGGVTCRELFHLELELLSTIKWWTWVELSLYEEYVSFMQTAYAHFLPPRQ